jgi:4-hydroxy-3-methylbut-2-enyl diphosphate reductase
MFNSRFSSEGTSAHSGFSPSERIENRELNIGQILRGSSALPSACHESALHNKVTPGILLVGAKWFAGERAIAVKVIRAKAMGMCFGVKDALSAIMMIDYPEKATIYGQLVHNPEVLKRIGALGFSMLEESNRTPAVSTPRVVITAHGLSDKERGTLEASGKTLIDTTCPLVSRVHQIAKGWHEQGYFVVVAGRKDHVEVKGIVGDLERCAVVERPEDVTAYQADRIAVVCQTTTPPALRDGLFETISRQNAGKVIQFVDTICGPTRERQEAVEDLLPQVQALVVVGGKNSNNTRQLRALGEKAGVPCFQVERASELRPEWFYGLETVGLTAGTSTLDETIDEVYGALIEMEVSRDTTIRK